MAGNEKTDLEEIVIYSRQSENLDEIDIHSRQSENLDAVDIHSKQSKNTEEDEQYSARECMSLLLSFCSQCHPFVNTCFIREIQKLAPSFQKLLNSFIWQDDKKCLAIVGSFSEGSFLPRYSDVDLMVTDYSLICCDMNCLGVLKHSSNRKVLIADKRHSSPGYTLLLDLDDPFLTPARRDAYSKFMSEAEKVFGIPSILNIALKHKDYHDTCGIWGTRQGPALQVGNIFGNFFPKKLRTAGMLNSLDNVIAIPYTGNDIKAWLNRKRKHGWPPEEVKRQISEMQGYVVGVGQKGSPLEEYEWRICYTQVEIKLVHSLNEVQMMLYMKLKLFSNNYFKDTCSDITSYIIKNIMFWLAESVPNKFFQWKYFIQLTRVTLNCLMTCVRKKYLPNYMIPRRNLFAGKLVEHEQEVLLELLSSFRYSMSLDVFKDLEGHLKRRSVLVNILRLGTQFIDYLAQHISRRKFEIEDINDFIHDCTTVMCLNGTEKVEFSKCAKAGDIQKLFSVMFNSKYCNCLAYTFVLLDVYGKKGKEMIASDSKFAKELYVREK
ncbi:uncharacterized protein LOC123534825 [Mercenaria mercenaria]|uniref:uncharacterized protein LOC123534825 n=1 Tax=Mercenaria mercenaria TaxID=6596 RepID=UPI00234E9FE8|nr:uncharacterized protein LOC123534825 [Mercenaria mercenaria]XP_053375930.1 uncharacterized protein LOC123534825 [Mercenaria mercenaria]